MSKILGIDLGTHSSCMAVMEGNEPVVIANAEGTRTTPSVVAFKKDGTRLVGASARRQAITNPDNTIYSSKRFIGHQYIEIEHELDSVSYKVKKGKKGTVVFPIPALDNKELTPEEVGAAILSKLVTDAQAYLGEKITQAVITVPAYFNDSQKKQTKVAGEIAGLEVLRIINEPTAAALAYGSMKNKEGNIFVFDLGGGTFDVSCLFVKDGVYEILATNGNSRLGGDDFDWLLSKYILGEIKTQSGVDLQKDSAALQRIREAAEKAKIELSSQLSTNINLPFITALDNNPVHFDSTITRAKFEEISKSLLEKMKQPVLDVLKDSNIDKSKIDEVLLVGGSSRIPCVQQLVKDLLGVEPSKGVNPDEAVALGSCIQASILSGHRNDLVLLEINPLSLSVEVNNGMVDVLIPKGTTIPASRKNVYTTSQNNQQIVTVNVLQGERPLAKANKSLGMFNLDGIALAPAHVPQIEVEFSINSDGLLSVTAKDLATNKEQKITITQSSNLDKDEVERMIKEAEEFAEADKEAKEEMLTRNEAESLCNSMESTLDLAKDKVEESLIEEAKSAIKSTRTALAGTDKEEIVKQKDNLMSVSHKISEILYKTVGEPGDSNAEYEQIIPDPAVV